LHFTIYLTVYLQKEEQRDYTNIFMTSGYPNVTFNALQFGTKNPL